ncbi:hypothetical protein LZ32DRAFT_160149 [Colletotrichum eremochloae]|nr:hypothetical protein LZ32DRAFT_160149 [Colletotrichum eremochloae]
MLVWCHLAFFLFFFSFDFFFFCSLSLFFLLRLSSGSSWTIPRKPIGERVLTAITVQSKKHTSSDLQRFSKEKKRKRHGGMLDGSTGEIDACSTGSKTDRDRARGGGPSRRESIVARALDPCSC